MAKSGVSEEVRATAAKVVELKKDLQKLLRTIADEDDVNLEKVDRAHQVLLALKELKLKKASDLKLRHKEAALALVPEEFKCPLSKEIMRDPVIVSSGQTYERAFIQNWLKSGKRTCPQTEQVLSFTTLTPNHLIRDMIANWCKNYGIKLPDEKYNDEKAWSVSCKHHFESLLKKMPSSTLPEQKQAAKELRLMTQRSHSIRALFSETPNAVVCFVDPLYQSFLSDTPMDQGLKEDIITTILNISIHESNKKLVADTPLLIRMLIDAVKSGEIQIRCNAAAALFTLCDLGSNKDLVGKLDALDPLIKLLDEGHPLAMKDATSAIFSICVLNENKLRAVSDGAIGVIMKKLKDRVQVEELISLLALLSTIPKAIEEMIELSAVSCLLGIIKEISAPRTKENCIAILYTICDSDPATWKELREEEEMHHTISQMTRDGNPRAKRKAKGVLDMLMKADAHISGGQTHSA